MLAYGRKYKLYVVQPRLIQKHISATGYDTGNNNIIQNKENQQIQSFIVPNGYTDMLTLYDGSLLVENPIQLEATIEYGSGGSGTPQTCEIKLYNLNDEYVKGIKSQYTLMLEAGYESLHGDNLPMLYLGTIATVKTEDMFPNKVTTITCTETNVKKDVQYIRTFMLGDLYDYVLLDMADKFAENGIPTGRILGNNKTKTSLGETISFSGNLSQQLTDVCNAIGFVWFISKGKLYIQSKTEDRIQDFFEIAAENVVGNLAQTDSKTPATTNADTKSSAPVGITGKVFLAPDLDLAQLIKVNFGQYEGTYKPSRIRHNLNWKNGPWQTEFESQAVNNLTLNQNI